MSFARDRLLMVVLVVLLGLVIAQMPATCLNRRCRSPSNGCQNSEYDDGKCANGTIKCCDKVCTLGAPVTTCGASTGCFSVSTSPIAVGAAFRTASCTAKVVVSTTPCTSTTCRDCVESMGSWSVCSLTCSSLGSQSRQRIATAPIGKGKPCMLPVSEFRECTPTPPPCPIPCGISPWSEWSPCNAPCAPAQKQRVRALVPPQFGAPACPHASELVDCAELAPCTGSNVIERTPFPTPVQIAPPEPTTAPPGATPPPATDDPTASIFVRASEVAETVFADPSQKSAVSLPNMLGKLRAAAYGPVAGALAFSLSGASIGCQVIGAPIADVAPGELIEPLSLIFDFAERRSFVRIALSSFQPGDLGLLIGRSATANRTIELTAPDNSFVFDPTGFAEWELRAANGTFGLLVFSVLSAVATPPTPAPPLATDTMADTTEATLTTTADLAVGEPSAAPAGNDLTLVIALSIAGAILLLAAVIVVVVARRRRKHSVHEPISAATFRAPQPLDRPVSLYAPVAAPVDRLASSQQYSPIPSADGSAQTDYTSLDLSAQPHPVVPQLGTAYSNMYEQQDVRQYSDVPHL